MMMMMNVDITKEQQGNKFEEEDDDDYEGEEGDKYYEGDSGYQQAVPKHKGLLEFLTRDTVYLSKFRTSNQ